MAKTGVIFWEVGNQLPIESWNKTWERNESVASEMFEMPEICTLQIFFYPAGQGDSDTPSFKLVRINTTLRRRRIQGKIQLFHGIFPVAPFDLDHDFERGRSDFIHTFQRFPTLHTLQIFHSLPVLCYRWIYTVLDPDPNETEPEPDIITSVINYVRSFIFGWG